MPHWVLACKHCGRDFPHSEINAGLVRLDVNPSGWVDKPIFPEGGQRMECPNCHETAIYQRYMLRYVEQHSGKVSGDQPEFLYQFE